VQKLMLDKCTRGDLFYPQVYVCLQIVLRGWTQIVSLLYGFFFGLAPAKKKPYDRLGNRQAE